MASLLGRPKKSELEQVKKERDQRPNTTIDKYNQLLDNQKPSDLPAN